MRRGLGVACDFPNTSNQLHSLHTSDSRLSILPRSVTASSPRAMARGRATSSGRERTVEDESRTPAARQLEDGISVVSSFSKNVANDMVTASLVDRNQTSWADVNSCAANGISKALDPILPDVLLEQFQFHRAPAGMADRIAAASERHASRQHGEVYGMYDNLPAVYALKAVAAPAAMRLEGVPLAGRQLTRLYDMARAADAVDVGALAGVPATAAAALLLLLATAQPPPHPAVATTAGTAAAATAAADRPPRVDAAVASCSTPAVPAALLARYLRVGSRSHNPLDTVRVMWALLRLQLPGAGPLLQPLELDGRGSSSSSSDAGIAAAATWPPPPPPPASSPPDPMTQLARILSRQLQNRDRSLAALRAARPGELYGTWQLAVHTLVLLRDRALANERSAAALAELDSALALLEAALSGSSLSSSSTSRTPGSGLDRSGSVGSGSQASADCSSALPLWPSATPPPPPPRQQQQRQSRGQQRQGSCGDAAAGGFPSTADSAAAAAAAAPGSAAVEALQEFLELSREVSSSSRPAEVAAAAAGRGGVGAAAAAAAAAAISPSAGSGGGNGVHGLGSSPGSGSIPGWDLVPSSDSEWRTVLGDPEQGWSSSYHYWYCTHSYPAFPPAAAMHAGALMARNTPGEPCPRGHMSSVCITPPVRTALLLSTWPELGRLVELPPPPPPPPLKPREVPSPSQQQQQLAAVAAFRDPPDGEWKVVTDGGTRKAVQGAAGGAAGEAKGGLQEGGGTVVQRRRLRIHLKSYSTLHFRTLELLYRSIKAQAPDATLLAALSVPEAAAAATETAAAASSNTDAAVQVGVVAGARAGAMALERPQQMLLNAVALPYSAAVDMVFTDARGRRVGLSLAHLGASRRAPGEIAVLQYALTGWPEADVTAAQQGFRAARSAARAAAAAAAAAEASRAQMRAAGAAPTAAAAAAATAAAVAMVDAAAAAAAAAAEAANQSCAEGRDAVGRMRLDGATAAAAQGCAAAAGKVRQASTVAAAAANVGSSDQEDLPYNQRYNHHNDAVDHHHGGFGKIRPFYSNESDKNECNEEDCLSPEERVAAEAAAAALEADAAAVAAAPDVVAAAAAEAAAAAAAAAVCAGSRGSGISPVAAAAAVAAAPPPLRNRDLLLQLDDLVVLELDHDWFHLRESYYNHVQQHGKWDLNVRQAISTAMSYTELPWEAQLDMVWHVLATAGVELPIRIFA
ncbi:hypothetical protein VOLCADRAFT_91703 [Volvox carteri f. nagariensis]|uniref:Uncharacterized protein n=1 Tax=Volvox carteri f. nagariensis TaxID=3068 RepID=D8TXS4_VOLCA|nr:uncharacterized protein VOLCADRAFT_91703 [Volvox carteri f. nagariensis]EFJ47775.1 hypothetical protein VOLCADRAFT_91703 [Volvox carteri f. nagariensis]|eukprot:XP_002951246.1 hypothetical protein VOLCADRAFT_91703 [Volvox carteri f. nagariensis]